MNEEESTLLPKNGSTASKKNSVVQLLCVLLTISTLLIGSVWFLVGAKHNTTPVVVVVEPDLSPNEQQQQEEEQESLYRDTCYSYATKGNKQPPPRILQTSMHEASQPWTWKECMKHSSEVVKLNSARAPDAILVTNFSHVKGPEILGFGGAFTEATALNFQRLSKQGQETALELLFGKTHGLGYSMGRVPIHSCDFSVSSYTFDDTPDDFEMDSFDRTVQHDVENGMIDLIQRAQQKLAASYKDEKLRLLASPWSPPAWMKRPTWEDDPDAIHASKMTYSATPSCLRREDDDIEHSPYAAAWAKYMASWLEAYQHAHNISVWAVTVQNEPEFPAPWEACAYDAQHMADFVTYHLGPQLLQQQHSHNTTARIFAFDHNKDHVVDWMKTLLPSPFLAGTAYHWYAGGMDRLLDGALGIANLHRLREHVPKDHLVLGSEACHCPTTGYAGGDIDIYWARAERYAHTILADLAAGSQGWVEWNLLLDSIGGPNHLGNLCDAPLLAVPQRAVNASSHLKPLPDFEHHKPMGDRIVGDDRTREELNALGFPATFLDHGIAVQPIFHYTGHISKYVRPGSKSAGGIVRASFGEGHIFRPVGATVAGGGENNLARNGMEILLWPCEGSTRQQFRWEGAESKISISGHDWLGNPTESCMGRENDEDFRGVRLTDCKKAGLFTFVPLKRESTFLMKLLNPRRESGDQCLTMLELSNGGGSYGALGGAQVRLGSCSDPTAEWNMDSETGVVSLTGQFDNVTVCMTTGWPFLQMGAFVTPKDERLVVILNEAKDAANYAIRDGDTVVVTSSIPPRSIQTVFLDP